MYDPYNPNPYQDKSPQIEANFKRNRVSPKKTGIGTVNAGGAVIIIIFVVLCLTIFGLLSFATSFADKKLADKNLANVSQYYKADSAAEGKLAMLYDAVQTELKAGGDNPLERAVRSAAEKMTFEISAGIAGVGSVTEAASVFYRTELEFSKEDKVRFYLDSGISFHYDENTAKLTYKIFLWKITMESEFEYGDGNLDVWSGVFD